jgi:hypothetical protein
MKIVAAFVLFPIVGASPGCGGNPDKSAPPPITAPGKMIIIYDTVTVNHRHNGRADTTIWHGVTKQAGKTTVDYYDCDSCMVTINCKETPFEVALERILMQSKQNWFYEPPITFRIGKVTLSLHRVSLTTALNALLEQDSTKRVRLEKMN